MNDNHREDDLQHLADLPFTTENPGYTASEMVQCPKCSRASAPNRFKCIYCGADLEIGAKQIRSAKLTLRPADDWEQGQNVILIEAETADTGRIASILNLARELIDDFVSSGCPLPILRLSNPAEADVIVERLAECGAAVRVISDHVLDAEHPPRRLRGIKLPDTGTLSLLLFSGGEPVDIGIEDVALIVTGTIRRSQLATSSKRKKGSFKPIDESATSSDTSVIDIYARADARGYRVLGDGFDFSGLGSRMTALSASNIKILTEELTAACPAARTVDLYDDISWLLDVAWPVGSTRSSGGVQRGPVGGIGMSTVETSDNTKQLTRFSRLCFQLL